MRGEWKCGRSDFSFHLTRYIYKLYLPVGIGRESPRSVRLYEVNFSCEVWCQLLDLVNFEQQVMSVRLPVQVQYRNGTYFGVFQNYQRSGHGVLVLDNSQILLAQWKKNTVHGKYVFISDQLRAYGTMLQGRLDGYNIIATTPNGQNAQTQTLYGMFREDRLYGKAVSVSGGQVTVGQFASSELKEVISRSSIKNSEVYEALTQHFPKNMYTLQEFLIAFMREAGSAIQDEEEVPRYMPVVLAVGEDRFFGYEECFNKGRRYGFILKENKVLSVGEHNGNLLQGIGRFYADDVIEDGIFKEGHLRGIGIKFYYQGNKYTLGQHDGKSSLERGFGFPTREVCEIRKQFHLRSIYFYNDIVMLGLTAHFTGLLSSLALDGKTKRESPKFTEDRRQSNSSALYKYEVDQDIVEDSSPIKDKFSEYKPVDRKTNKYFTLDQEEQEYDRRKQKDRSLNKMGNYRDIKNEPSNTRFTEQGNSRGRVGVVESRDRSATRGGRSGVKDTREFVRQLQEEEKRKRLDLDKIYRQAGLYKKR